MGDISFRLHPAQPHRAPGEAFCLSGPEAHHAGESDFVCLTSSHPDADAGADAVWQGKFSNIPILEGFFHTAKSILARFHFVCNGSVPLRTLDWTSSEVANMAQLDPDQVRFMQETQEMIQSKGMSSLLFPCPFSTVMRS